MPSMAGHKQNKSGGIKDKGCVTFVVKKILVLLPETDYFFFEGLMKEYA